MFHEHFRRVSNTRVYVRPLLPTHRFLLVWGALPASPSTPRDACSLQSPGVSVPLPRSPLIAGAQRPSLVPALRAVPPLTWVELTIQGFLRRRSCGQCFPSDRPAGLAGLTAGGRDALCSPSPVGDAVGEGPECLWLHLICGPVHSLVACALLCQEYYLIHAVDSGLAPGSRPAASDSHLEALA